MTSIQNISWFDISGIGILLLISGLTSLLLRLKLEKPLLIASLRTFIQLVALGFILEWVFDLDHWLPVLALLLIMVLMAAYHAVKRSHWTYRGSVWVSLFALAISTSISAWIVSQVIVGVTPWYSPQYLIPLAGMILGNSLTGISLGIDRFLSSIKSELSVIQGRLFLGATAWEAVRPALRQSVYSAHVPILNAMTIAGIVSLPGMMTGQILAGVSPILAVRYQIVVMFMIAAACSIGAMIFMVISAKRLFTDRHQINDEIIQKRMR